MSKSSDYWRKREEEWLAQIRKSEKAQADEVQAIYDYMLDEIEKEINSFFEKYAAKEGISMAEAKKRADTIDIEAYMRKAAKYVKEKDFSEQANKEMLLYNMTMKVNRLELLKSSIGLDLVAGHDELKTYMGEKLTDHAVETLRHNAAILGPTVMNDADRKAKVIVNSSFHNATFLDRVWQHQDVLRNELTNILSNALIAGRNPREFIPNIRKRFDVSRYQAERLLRTELARVQIEAQKESYKAEDIDEYEYIACGLGDVCDVCRALDGKHFKVSKMLPGENAPVMHPSCHCSTAPWFDRNEFDEYLEDPDADDMTFEEWKKQKNQEKERINIPDTGKNVPGHVNSRLINTKTYHNKFEGLTSHKAVNESLYNESLQILSDNNDTQYEHIVAIDAKTGERLAKNTSAADNKMILQSGFSKGQNSMLSNESTPLFEAVHNHPNNSIPSRDDIIKLFERPRQISSVIICHNGAVYRLEKLEKYEKVDDLANKIYSFNKKKYIDYSEDKAEYECSMSLIKYLVKKGVMAYEKR